jgi:hypothetical protein
MTSGTSSRVRFVRRRKTELGLARQRLHPFEDVYERERVDPQGFVRHFIEPFRAVHGREVVYLIKIAGEFSHGRWVCQVKSQKRDAIRAGCEQIFHVFIHASSLQIINKNKPVIRGRENVPREVATDEAGGAGDEYFRHNRSRIRIILRR